MDRYRFQDSAAERIPTEWLVAPGFEPVAEAFDRSFSERGEVGAAFAVVVDGVPVLDLWGGLADRVAGHPWERDTLQVVFSGTKGLVATCLAILLDRRQLDLDAPVAEYWPEFGKERIRVRHLASHTSGLPGLERAVALDEMLDDRRMAALLAEQAVWDDPRAGECYHPLTYGWLCGELVRRVDGRSVGRFFDEEVATPLGLEIWIGLPEKHEPRVSRTELGSGWETDSGTETDALTHAVFANPPFFDPTAFPWNRRDFHAAEIPGAGAIATARSIARLYGCLAGGGELDGVRLVSEETLEVVRRELSHRHDPLLDIPMAFGVGFQLQTATNPYGPPATAFGHGGAGGSNHGAWPDQRVGYSYAMNQMRGGDDTRALDLLDLLYEALSR